MTSSKAPTYSVVSEEERKLDPYPYVSVEDDGSYRELTAEEREYLQEEFSVADGARPYVKFRYRSITPDKKLGGYLKRIKMPKDLKPGIVPTQKKWWQFW